MAKRSHRKSARREKENNVGCVWGLIHMLYFRRDPKFLLDQKQGSRRRSVRGHSNKKLRDFDEIDEEENLLQECNAKKTTVKKLMEVELGRAKPLKKIPNDEVERILSDLGHDVSLEKSSTQTSKPKMVSDHYVNNLTAPLPGLVDPCSSKNIHQAAKNNLEFVLADFLVEIYRYHNECQHGDCKNMSELCPALKSIIHKKLNDLSNSDAHHSDLQGALDGAAQSCKENNLPDEKHLNSSRAAQSKEFMDALEILSSNKELFLKLLQKPNLHMLENIQNCQKRKTGDKLADSKVLERSNFVEEISSSSQHEVSTKTVGKESKHIFFWKKDKTSRRQTSEGTGSSQLTSRIVVLKPNPGRGPNPTIARDPSSLHQEPCAAQTPEYGERVVSKFSIKEIRRRFRLVTGETRKEKNLTTAGEIQKGPHQLKDSVIAPKQLPRQQPATSLASKPSSDAKYSSRPSTSQKQKISSNCQGDINNNASGSDVASFFYEEAKKHLTEMLKDKGQSEKLPTVKRSTPLAGMLSLPDCSVSSPRSSPRINEDLNLSPKDTKASNLSPKDTKASPSHQFEEESDKDPIQSNKSSEYITHDASVAADNQRVDSETRPKYTEVQEGHCIEEESIPEGTTVATHEVDILSIERPYELDCSYECCIPTERCKNDPVLEMREELETEKEPLLMSPSSPESIIEKLEQQDPETPKASISAAFISHSSPESSHEKPEQPSPVSVLDSFFYEDIDSSNCRNTTDVELHEDSSVPLYFPDTERNLRIFWEDKNVRFEYIKSVLDLSGLSTDKSPEIWYLADQLLDPSLFNEVQAQSNQVDNLKLLFDCICEALTEIQERYFRFSPWLSFLGRNIQTHSIGGNIIPEVNKCVDRHLQFQFPRTLEQVVKKDLEDGIWMDLRSESEGITIEIWEFVLDELIDEAVFDLWI